MAHPMVTQNLYVLSFTAASKWSLEDRRKKMKIKDLVNESDFVDLGPRGVGSELDIDDFGGKEFKAPRMFDQLAKCADNINGQAEVKTDDGKTILCKSSTAKKILDMERSISTTRW